PPAAPILLQAVSNPVFAAPDLLLYVRAHTLIAQRLDLRLGRPRGEPTPLGEEIAHEDENHFYGFAAGGDTLVYQSNSPDWRLVFFDRSGRRVGEVGEPGPWADIALSPDGTRVVA